tara:strand:- start:9965 stop:10837 length:873 start_codon:yes stop_codon:yes gene_type:complete
MWWEVVRKLLKHDSAGSRDGDAREMTGFVGRFPATHDWVWCPGRKLSAAYAAGELLWYLGGHHNGEQMIAYAPQYKRFLDDDGTAYGAYGGRIADFRQFQYAHDLLVDQPRTRQAVISLWHPKDLNAALGRRHPDMPCTLSLQFLLRDGQLDLHSTMRSNDAWLGLPYDGWCFSQMLKLMASALNVEAGWIQHQVGSMHLYERNADKAQQACSSGPLDLEPRLEVPRTGDWDAANEMISWALEIEKEIRTKGASRETLELIQGYGAIGEWLRCIAVKFGADPEILEERLR